jgi:hypothetical protein
VIGRSTPLPLARPPKKQNMLVSGSLLMLHASASIQLDLESDAKNMLLLVLQILLQLDY